MTRRIALIGGRGYTGGELLGLIAGHAGMDLGFASSTSQAGSAVQAECPLWPDPDTRFIELEKASVPHHKADAWVLAVPNGAASRRNLSSSSVMWPLTMGVFRNPGAMEFTRMFSLPCWTAMAVVRDWIPPLEAV